MISVIIPVWNGMPHLEGQLRAVAGQECGTPWEVVVADNGSSDGSRELARAWADQREEFHLIDASAVRGPSAARNAGVRVARGDLLAFCDADDLVGSGWLRACVEALGSTEVVSGVFDFWSLNGREESPPIPPATRQMGFLPAGLGANLAVRREAFDKVGGFDEDLQVAEDIDLCWRLQLDGLRFGIAPEAVVAKRGRTGVRQLVAQGYAYGLSAPSLYRRYRAHGARPDLTGALRSWLWLVVSIPRLGRVERRQQWARTVGMRIGRLVASARHRVLFP